MATNSRYSSLSSSKRPIFIRQLPFLHRREVCRILDADGRWEDLGGYMGYDVTTLTLIGQAIQRDKSPTSELLNKWDQRNGTIKELFIMLCEMDHQRAMSILLPHVGEKYQNLLRSENTISTAFMCSKDEELPRPSPSQLSMFSQKSSHFSGSISGAAAAIFKSKENLPYSKFQNDIVNMNQNFSSVSLQSKMNTLLSSELKEKKASDMKLPKNSTNSKDESESDNCASAKIKNKHPLLNENLLNGRLGKQMSNPMCASNLSSLEEAIPDVMQISYRDICKATDDFNKARILGRGGFGTVYKGEWKGTSVAIKRLMPREGHDNSSQQLVSLKQSLNELKVLKCCRFDHILPLYGVSLDGADPCLVYQLMVNGSLEDKLLCRNNTPPLKWSQRSHIAECTTKGLNYLHTTPGKPLVHGDIKSANILLDANMDAKIGDFGLTREGPDGDSTHVNVTRLHGTSCYLPPEYLRHKQLSPSVDIFSYGIVLLEMATGLRPYDVKRGDAKNLVDFVSDCSNSGRLESLRDTRAGEENMLWFRELLKIGQKCSSEEKRKRPTMQEVLEQFKKIKTEMSVMDRLRRLSADKGNSGKPRKLSFDAETMKLSPIHLQLFYDFRNDGQSAASSHNATEGTEQKETPPKAASPVPEDKTIRRASPTNNIQTPVAAAKDSETSEVTGNEVSSDYDESSIGTAAESGQNVTNDESSASGKAPLPLLTVLQLQISQFNNSWEESASNSERISSNISTTSESESIV